MSTSQPEGIPAIPWPYRAVAALCFLTGLAVLAAGIAVADRTTRADRAAAQATAVQPAEVTASRWRSTAATALFPTEMTDAGVGYLRQGVAPQQDCAVLPAALRARLAGLGCVAVLEGTYVDTTLTVVATVGVVVLTGGTGQRAAFASAWSAGLTARQTTLMPHALPFPGTLAAGFTDATRTTWNSQVDVEGSYLCFAVTGFADGRAGPDAASRLAGDVSALDTTSPPVTAAADLPGVLLAALTSTTGGAP